MKKSDGRYRACIYWYATRAPNAIPFCHIALEIGAAGGTRTPDQRIKSPMLYQLSYRSNAWASVEAPISGTPIEVAASTPVSTQNGTGGGTRTRDQRFRKPLLYPTELLLRLVAYK